jgi:hypothetical protein
VRAVVPDGFGAYPIDIGTGESRVSCSGFDKSIGRTLLLLILGSSPMVEGIPAFFAASRYGVALIMLPGRDRCSDNANDEQDHGCQV